MTALELMPLHECAERWNWGYDSVQLFAPYHVYGRPELLWSSEDPRFGGSGIVVPVEAGRGRIPANCAVLLHTSAPDT